MTPRALLLVLIVAIVAAIGIVYVFPSAPTGTSNTANISIESRVGWEWTETCYTAVGNPTTPAPGPACGMDTDQDEITTCQYDGREYAIGESFAAIDGCNTCSCSEDTRTVLCTLVACTADR